MKRPFKQSIEAIENDLYQLLQIKKGQNLEIDNFVERESNLYFQFQKNILNLVSNKISISSSGAHFIFNDIAMIYNDGTGTIKYSSSNYANNNNNIFVSFWTGKTVDESIVNHFTLAASDKKHININVGRTVKQKINEEALQTYFFKNLRSLANKYDVELSKSLDFLIPLKNIVISLKESGADIQAFFKNEEYYSTFSIYDIMNKNKDIFSLTLDTDISSNLEKMKLYLIKNNKLKKNYENTI